jgi:phenylpyruvate tautomerase PptA (4-oxalocrotonate tautomerase family)
MMNNARPILMQILAVIGSNQRSERDIDDFCSWIEVQVMTELFASLPADRQEQAINQFMILPPDKKESVFYPYYTVAYMRGRVKTATKKAIVERIVEPHWDQLSPSQQESIRSLLEDIER